jgi:hypothetical protein
MSRKRDVEKKLQELIDTRKYTTYCSVMKMEGIASSEKVCK